MNFTDLGISPNKIEITELTTEYGWGGALEARGSFRVRRDFEMMDLSGWKINIPAGATSSKEMAVEKVKIEKVPIYGGYPKVRNIIYSGNKTIVLWEDGTKTVVGCSEGETYDEFDGFTAALAKKIYGSTCAVKREIRKKSKHQ